MIAEKPQLQIVTSWDRLRQVLLRAIDRQRYHFGYVFERVEQDGSGVHVYFANGRTERADLLVGCDGFRSTVRAHLAPEVQPIYSGYYIWRGAPNESDLSPDTRRTMFPYFSFFLSDQLQALGYPISGADDELRAGHRRYNFGWYRVADFAKLKHMCADDNGREYEFGVPPPLVRKDLIAQMRAEAETLLPPQYLDCLRHIDQPFFTPVYDFCSPKLTFGRVALVGDAASTPRPHMGFGVSKAGAEAQALAEALSNYDDIDRALAAYNAARQPLSERIVSHGRKLGMQLGVGITTPMKIAASQNCCRLPRESLIGLQSRISWMHDLRSEYPSGCLSKLVRPEIDGDLARCPSCLCSASLNRDLSDAWKNDAFDPHRQAAE